MANVLLDSDVIIEIMRDSPEIIRKVETFWREGNALFCCPVALAEVYRGLRPKETAKTEEFFRTIECVPITKDAGKKAWEYMARYHKSHNVKLGDALVAAVCSSNKTMLYTLNKKHYPMKDITVLE